jgi:hypothetical protein
MAIAIAVGAVGVGALLLFATSRGPGAKDASSAATAARSTAATVQPAPATTVSTPPEAWTAVPTASASAAPPNRLPPTVPVSALATVRHAAPGAAGQAPASPTPPVTPPAAPPASKTSCNPPYEFDENGNKRWKRECL